MRNYDGDEPCAGCGTPGRERKRRYKSDICRECHELIRLGTIAKSEQKTEGYAVVRLSDYSNHPFKLSTHDHKEEIKDAGLNIDCFVSSNWHYFVGHRIPNDKLEPNADSEHILKALRRLLNSINQPEQAQYDFRMTMQDVGWREGNRFYLNHETALAIFHLWDVIGKYTNNVYEYGYSEGSSLLTKLACGNVSIDDFNKATIRK